jgi:hypothetical protein
MQIQELNKKASGVVKKLRISKLKSGRPFMINTSDLPSYQCYIEHPDGTIQLVAIAETLRDYIPVRTLSEAEQNSIRKKYRLV